MTDRISFTIKSTGNSDQDQERIYYAAKVHGLTNVNASRVGSKWYITGTRPSVAVVPQPINRMKRR